ncbi:uncharacterized protein [Bemisia tabaci]|uniref:uncharacterized protein n=1 Tax=Bemisia tabaci TaxID=7038 RepID=UPI003B285242
MNNEQTAHTPPGEFGTPGTGRSSESDANSGSEVTGVQNGSAPLRSLSCNDPETNDGLSTHDSYLTELLDATPSTPTPPQTQGGEGTQIASPAYGTPQGTVAREIFQLEQRIRRSNSNDLPRSEDAPTPGKRARRRHSDSSVSSTSPSPQKRHWDRKSEAQEAFEIADKSAKVVERLRQAFTRLRRKEKTYSWKDFMERDNVMLDELLENQQKLASIILGRATRFESYPESLIHRDSGTQTSPMKSPPPPTDTPDIVVLEDDVGANEDLNNQNNPWGGPEIIVPAQPSTSAAGVTAQGPQVPPQPPPLPPPPYPLQPPKHQRPKNTENDAVTIVNNAGGTEFLMMQFSKMIREEVTRAIDMRLGQPDKQTPPRQKGNRIEQTRPESQRQPASTPPTSPRGEPPRPGGGGGYSETWQEVVTRNYQGVRGPRAETHPSSKTTNTTNNRFTPLGGGNIAKRREREPFPSLPPPQSPSPSTPGKGKKKKKGAENPSLNPQRPPEVQQETSNAKIREKNTFPGADIIVQPRYSNATVTCNDVWTELTKTVNPREVGVQPLRWARTRDAQVRVTCATQSGAEALAAAVNAKSSNLTASVQGKQNPRIAFHGVPVGLPNDDLTAIIREQTGADNGYTYKYTFGSRSATTNVRVYECSPDILQTIALLPPRWSVGWAFVTVREHLRLMQCHRCQLYGHLQAVCTNREPTCKWCAGNHDSGQCRAKSNKNLWACAGCKKHRMPGPRHASGDTNLCAYYKLRRNDLERSINYGHKPTVPQPRTGAAPAAAEQRPPQPANQLNWGSAPPAASTTPSSSSSSSKAHKSPLASDRPPQPQTSNNNGSGFPADGGDQNQQPSPMETDSSQVGGNCH